mmetsp:Transcript_96797/g.244062  ORF Transcript_96797/g.244062 Transcript_96797/m.244062 type:complete len:218 (-) Transcript_96797:1072-1725(-)
MTLLIHVSTPSASLEQRSCVAEPEMKMGPLPSPLKLAEGSLIHANSFPLEERTSSLKPLLRYISSSPVIEKPSSRCLICEKRGWEALKPDEPVADCLERTLAAASWPHILSSPNTCRRMLASRMREKWCPPRLPLAMMPRAPPALLNFRSLVKLSVSPSKRAGSGPEMIMILCKCGLSVTSHANVISLPFKDAATEVPLRLPVLRFSLPTKTAEGSV